MGQSRWSIYPNLNFKLNFCLKKVDFACLGSSLRHPVGIKIDALLISIFSLPIPFQIHSPKFGPHTLSRFCSGEKGPRETFAKKKAKLEGKKKRATTISTFLDAKFGTEWMNWAPFCSTSSARPYEQVIMHSFPVSPAP